MSSLVMNAQAPSYLREWQAKIEKHARDMGLDFFPVIFEVLPYDRINEVAAYGGFPTRYPHWRFGMEYERLAKSYEYGLSKIYELVINNVPSIAYLLEGNSMVEQKLVIAHVLGHVDFFKNNFAFTVTNQGVDQRDGGPVRKWVDTMANNAATARKWSNRLGVDVVEEFIDSCLSLENLIDPQKPFLPQQDRLIPRSAVDEERERETSDDDVGLLRVDRDYMEGYINPDAFVAQQKQRVRDAKEKSKHFPESPRRDVIDFILEHAPLERWEHDVLDIVRDESYYFLPQMQTKIMNEGWASYWHSTLMTSGVCDGEEMVDYAERNAGVMASAPGQLNPYKLGVELYRHIEEGWNRGQFGKEWDECTSYEKRQSWDLHLGLGRAKIFEVRKLYTDVTFIDEFLTPDFVAQHKLYSFGFSMRNDRWEIESRKFDEVKSKLLAQLTNAGSPIIRVVDANLGNRGELELVHEHMGVDLRIDWARQVMKALVRVWKRPVQLRTIVEDKPTLLRYDGKEHSQQAISA